MKKISAVLALTLVLAGCGVGRVGPAPTLFDLGLDLRPTPSLAARPPLAMVFDAVPALSQTGVIWRVGDSAHIQSYATYQWASPPAELVRQRLIERLSRQGPVLGDRSVLNIPQLQVTLASFEQVFSATGTSSVGRVVLQVVLLRGNDVLGQVRIAQEAAAPSNDAAGGVAALRQATDDASDSLAQWLAGNLK